jgi:hypothetical protein
MNLRGILLLACALLLLAAAGCGGGPVTVVVTSTPTPEVIILVVTSEPPPGQGAAAATPEPSPTQAAPVETPPPPAQASIEVLEAVFAHGLSEQMQPVDPGDSFAPDETVYLSVRIKGRPTSGKVTASFYLGDTTIADATVDLADANSGLLFSIGEDTYAGYTLSHTDPFPLSEHYRADLYYEDQPLGSASFRVVPPADAIPSQVIEAVLAKGADENYTPIEPTTEFAYDEAVYLVGAADLGVTSWLQVEWYVGGERDDAGTRSITAQENLEDTGFSFYYLPEGGWPAGEHEVVLILNDEEVGRYSFTALPSE